MHPTAGLSVTSQSTKLTVKLPFFITPILPYSAVKGEELAVKIIVNNYGFAETDRCTVTVDGSESFNLTLGENEDAVAGASVMDTVSVDNGVGATVTVWLAPGVIDTISITATALCESGASDAFTRELLVKPAGFPKEACESEFVQIEAGGADVTHTFNIVYPREYVEESEHVQVQVTGDVMGPSIEGLDGLVQMPFGCGEQNMITFTPNIFVRRYLDNINKLDTDIKDLTTKYMQTGYQRELTYKHPDGSFSAFGTSDPSGSTWLTAFVMKCFRQAKDYIEIDQRLLENAMLWLDNQVGESGMLQEPGRVIHTEMQGGSSSGITLSAFVVIAILEDVQNPELSTRVINLSDTVAYLENNYDKIKESPYQMAIVTYALQLAGSGETSKFLTQLESLQRSSAGLVWWDLPDVIVASVAPKVAEEDIIIEPPVIEYGGPSSVEMTSYALLTYIAMNDVAKAKPVAMWLTKNRGGSGGFRSTQDTVLGLQALAGYAELVVSPSTNLQVDFTSDSNLQFSHTITADNAIITKKHSYKPAQGIKTVTARLSGEGSAIITTCTGYNVRTLPVTPSVSVTTKVTEPAANDTKKTLNACISFLGEGDSGMAIMEIAVPTGHSAAVDDVVSTKGDMARAEARTGGGVSVYCNDLKEDCCVNVKVVQDIPVKQVQDSYVIGAQYYNTEAASRAFYNPQSDAQVYVSTTPAPTGSAVSISSSVMLLFIPCLLYTLM